MLEGLDPGTLTGVGVIGVLLGLIFRTLWRQSDGWAELVVHQREATEDSHVDADDARQQAIDARADAAEARAAAEAARLDAYHARQETLECQIEHQLTERKLQFLVTILRTHGIDIPPLIEANMPPPSGKETS